MAVSFLLTIMLIRCFAASKLKTGDFHALAIMVITNKWATMGLKRRASKGFLLRLEYMYEAKRIAESILCLVFIALLTVKES